MDSNSFSADRPINSAKEDALNRAKFSHAIADAVRNWDGNDSLVIALCGSWGSGKSSVKNMMVEKLKEKKDGPYIVEFNPWQAATQKPIPEAFFRDIALAIGESDPSSDGDELKAKWMEYAAELTGMGSLVGENILKLFKWLFGLWAVTMLAASWIEAPAVKPIATVIAVLFLLLGLSSTALRQVARIFRSRAALREKPLHILKAELAKSLAESKKPVLVLLDDIDRLTGPEILSVCQLVKANADFPKLIYLLLFQRDLVESRLAGALANGASEYLEKIVQVTFTMPDAERAHIEKFLTNGLDSILLVGRLSEKFDKKRWGLLYHDGLRHYFKTLRDVKRFLSTLKFHVSLLSNSGILEVNPVDLIGIEVIRTFENPIYTQLAAHKDVLTKTSMRDGDRDKIKPVVDAIKTVSRNPIYHGIMSSLFPIIEWHGSRNASVEGGHEDWLRDLRICHPSMFARYFQLAVPTGDLSQSEVDQLLTVVQDEGKFRDSVKAVMARDLLGVLLERVFVNVDKIPKEAAVPIIKVLSELGEDLPERSELFQVRQDIQMALVIRDLLNSNPDEAERAEYFINGISSTEALFIPLLLIDLTKDRNNGDIPLKQSESSITNAKGILIERIKKRASAGLLATDKKLVYFLERWNDWGKLNEAMIWAKELSKSPTGAVLLATAFTNLVISSAGNRWHVDLKGLEKFASLQDLEEQLKAVESSKLTDQDQDKLKAFKRASERRRSGKPDLDWMSEGD